MDEIQQRYDLSPQEVTFECVSPPLVKKTSTR